MGVEFGRRRLLLPPPPRRLGEEGGGRNGARGRVGSALQLLSECESAAAAADGHLRRCGGGGPAGTRLSPGPEYVCVDPFLCSALPEASPEGVSGRPALSASETLQHRFRATLEPRAK